MMTKAENAREMNDFTRAVALQIRDEQRARQLTDVEVAKLAGMGAVTYGRMRKGQRSTDAASMDRIAKAFGLLASTLIARAEVHLGDTDVLEILASGSKANEIDKVIAWRRLRGDGDDNGATSHAV